MKLINSTFLPKDDLMFKAIFGSEGSENILKSFIEATLDINIKSLYLGNKEIINRPELRKKEYLDVLAVLDNGEKVNIEIQSKVTYDLEKRMLAYWAEQYVSSFRGGEKYNKLNKTYCIWILDEVLIKEVEEYHTKWRLSDAKLRLNNHFDDIEFHILELPKFREYAKIRLDETKISKLESWLSFIDYNNEEMIDMAVRTEEEINAAIEKYKELSQDEEMIQIYLSRKHRESYEEAVREDMIADAKKEGKEQGIKEGIKEGIEEGIKQGIEKGSYDSKYIIAKKMLSKGFSIEEVAELTGLSKEDVQGINS